ncbi:hypothetical protein H8356DRAFT_1348676 [Neocallimastix lanati (nom. inval.)]|nr:hypothetical protein H8356DRAFT_1348676 [Neocallimastix sp. JGI-2020a]
MQSSPETTLEIHLISSKGNPKKKLFSIINNMIDSYLTPDSLHCDYPPNFTPNLCMTKVFLDFNSSRSYFKKSD